MNINDDMYYDTLLSEQTAVFEENIQMSNELVSSFKKMIKSFEDLDDISSTGETINKLNSEIEKLKNTTSSLNKSISSSNNIMNTKPKEIDYKSDSALEKMNPRQQKKYFNSIMEHDEENTKYKSKASDVVSENDKELDVSGNSLTVSKLKFSNFQRDYENLKKTKEEKKPDDSSAPKEEGNPKTEPKKEKEQDEEKKKDDKLTKFGMFFAKSIGKSFEFSLKTVMSPITMTLKGMGGMLSGIWNSTLMGIAKTVAMIGALVLAFDWVKVTLNSWKTQMQDNYTKFMSENTVWGRAMTQLVLLGDAIQKFLDPNFESTLLKETEIGWISIAKKMGDTLMAILKDGLGALFDYAMLGIHNTIFRQNKSEKEWQARLVGNRGNFEASEVTEENYVNTLNNRKQRRSEAILGMTYDMKSSGDRFKIDTENYTDDDIIRLHNNTTQVEGAIKAYALDKGISVRESRDIYHTDKSVIIPYIKEAQNLLENMILRGVGNLDDKDTVKYMRKLSNDNFSMEDAYGKVDESSVEGALRLYENGLGNNNELEFNLYNSLEENIKRGHGIFGENSSARIEPVVLNGTYHEVGTYKDLEKYTQSKNLSSIENGNMTMLSSKMEQLVSLLLDKEGNDHSNFAQINNIQQSNSYGTSEPTGNVRYFGNESIRHGSVRY